MSKKMHDILPPGKVKSTEAAAKALFLDGKKNSRRPRAATAISQKTVRAKAEAARVAASPIVKSPKVKKQRKFPLKELLAGGAVIVFLSGAYAFIKLPKADIQIRPNLETITLQETIVADKAVSAINLAAKSIPAQYVEISKDASQDFPATGSAANEGKATGSIKIYNKISPSSPFTLKIGTHFLSDSGKYFVTTQRITIPGSKSGSPGSIMASVQAEESGSQYNIGASKFSLPKLSGTSYYYSIYGESTTPMSGGYTGKVKKVTDDDIQSARDVLTTKLLSQAEASLKSNLSSDDVLLDGAISSGIVNASASAKSGTIQDTFTFKASVKSSALVFKKQDLEKFAKSDINAQLDNTKNYLVKSLALTYTPKSIDISGGKETVSLQASAKTYQSIDTIELVNMFSQKSSDQIKQIVDQRYGGKISELTINFWPFWVTKAPSNKNRIKVNLNF